MQLCGKLIYPWNYGKIQFVTKHQNFVHCMSDIPFGAVENETNMALALGIYVTYNTNADLEGVEHTE